MSNRNKDSLLSQAAAVRTSMNRALAAAPPAKVEASASAEVEPGSASGAAAPATPVAAKKPNTIVVAMAISGIPLDVSERHSVYIPFHTLY